MTSTSERGTRVRKCLRLGRTFPCYLALLVACLAIASFPACRSKEKPNPPAVQTQAKAALPERPDPTLLLEEDLASGAITEDQAARYRIYRLFRPGEVPEKYRYQEQLTSATWDLLEVYNRFDKLSPDTARELEPYFLPPSDPRSAHRRSLSLPEPGFTLVPAAMASPSGGEEPIVETYDTETGYTIEIIGFPGATYSIQKVRELVAKVRDLVATNKIYEKIERLLGRKTLDKGEGALEIYVLKSLPEFEDEDHRRYEAAGYCIPRPRSEGRWLPPDKAACWIAVSAEANKEDYELASTLAHEIFHAFEFAFSCREEMWLGEGSAVWAEDFVGPDWNIEQRRLRRETFAPAAKAHNPLTLKSPRTAYGMFLFFTFLTRVREGGQNAVMRSIWERCEGAPGVSLGSVVTGAGGDFRDMFKKYALATLDVGDAQGRFPDQPGHDGSAPLDLFGAHFFAGLWKIDADGTIMGQGAMYLAGMTILYLQVDNIAEGPAAPAVRFDLGAFKAEAAMAVQAVIEYKDGQIITEDWTGRHERVFCLSQESQNFVTINIAVSRAEEGAVKDYVLDLAQAPDAECSLGQMKITIGARTDEELKRTRKWFTDNDAKTMTTVFDQEVAFLLELVPGSGVKASDAEAYVRALPEAIRNKAKGIILGPSPEFDEDSRCLVYRYKVKSCSVSSFRWSQIQSGQETQNDSFGLEYDRRFEDREAWALSGLDRETENALREESFVVDVHIDPDSNTIKWVDVRGPLVAAAKAAISHQQWGRQRIKEDPVEYEDITRSSSEEAEASVRVLDVSEDDPDLPHNPDWRAKESGQARARGEGRAERPLDSEERGEQGETTVIKGLEVRTLRWELTLSSNPRR